MLVANERLLVAANLEECDAKKKVLTPSSSFFSAADGKPSSLDFPVFCFTAPRMTHLCFDRKIQDGSRGGKKWAAVVVVVS